MKLTNLTDEQLKAKKEEVLKQMRGLSPLSYKFKDLSRHLQKIEKERVHRAWERKRNV